MPGRALTLVVLAVCLLLVQCGPRSVEPVDLLVITLDTTRADRIGAYGYAAARTPVIDRLAANGVRFEHAFAPNPTTLPSHTSLFTGLYPPSHGVRANGRYTLEGTHATLAESLAAAGYRTAAFIGAFPLDSRFGLDQGFGTYDDAVNPRTKTEGRGTAERSAAQVTDSALAWLRGGSTVDDPVFLWVHYFDPHSPYAPPEPLQGYDGEITLVDTQIGRLLGAIEKTRGLDRTLIVLTADHGESLGDHGEKTHGVFVYDATLRVPLVLTHPTLVGRPRVVDDAVVSLIDVVPTVLELLGVEIPAEVDGRHLLDDRRATDDAVYFDTVEPLMQYGWAPLRGLRTLREKLIEAPEPEHYALDDDPGELRNRFASAPPGAERLREELHREFGPADLADLAPGTETVDPEVIERLASLGYVGTRSTAAPAARRDPKRMLPLWNRFDDVYPLLRSGRPDEAVRLLDAIVEGDPDNGRAWFIRGMVLQSTGDLEEAETSLRNSVRVLPGADRYSRLAEILYLRERFDQGDAAVEEARRIEPRSGLPYVAEGVGLTLRKRYDEALLAFERARAIDPANAGTRAQELTALVEQMR
jgi:arylsulfatase A-like enzyme/Tfp pilus assembly protein PilF